MSLSSYPPCTKNIPQALPNPHASKVTVTIKSTQSCVLSPSASIAHYPLPLRVDGRANLFASPIDPFCSCHHTIASMPHLCATWPRKRPICVAIFLAYGKYVVVLHEIISDMRLRQRSHAVLLFGLTAFLGRISWLSNIYNVGRYLICWYCCCSGLLASMTCVRDILSSRYFLFNIGSVSGRYVLI